MITNPVSVQHDIRYGELVQGSGIIAAFPTEATNPDGRDHGNKAILLITLQKACLCFSRT